MALQRAGLLDLPLELLRAIIDELVDPVKYKGDAKDWNRLSIALPSEVERQRAHRKTIQSLRLTSKRLNQAASNVLLPVLTVHLNEESLAHAEQLANNPLIASGIQGIKLVLKYCPGNVAADLDMFTLIRLNKLSKMEDHCQARLDHLGASDDLYDMDLDMMLPDMNWGMDEFEDEDEDEDEESETSWESDSWIDDDAESLTSNELAAAQLQDENSAQQEKKLIALYKAAMNKWASIHTTGTICRDCSECTDIEKVQHAEHRELLAAAFTRFQATHKLQHALLTSGRFATTIGQIASKSPNLHSICFTDKAFYELQPYEEYSLLVANTLLDDTKLLDVLSAPMRWTNMAPRPTRNGNETPFFHTDKTAAALLCDIPVALARQNVHIRNLQVECAPIFRNTDLLRPQNGALQGSSQELQRAFSSLQSFCFRPLCREQNDYSLDLDSHRHVKEYIAACTSGTALIDILVHLDLYIWADEEEEMHFVELGDALHRPADALALTALDLQSASMPFDQLKRLCLQVSPQAQSCQLHQVYLSNGSCADIVDALRSVFSSRIKDDRIPHAVEITAFINENIYNYFERLIPSPYTFMEVLGVMHDECVFDNTGFYIKGFIDVNPLARFEKPPVLPCIPDLDELDDMDDMESD